MRETKSRARLSRVGVLAVFLIGPLLTTPTAAEQEYSTSDYKACLKCHENQKIMGILDTPHANPDNPKAPAALHQCESCHGPSATHMKFPLQVGNIRFTKHDETTAPEVRDRVCLECHQTGSRANWKMGPHGFERMSCPSCHSIHKSRDPALSAQQQTTFCTESCHAPIIATAPKKSPHPITGNGKLLCTQCHNPHGPIDLAVCASCHTQNATAFAVQPPKARGYHERALSQLIACTDCHQAFVHRAPELNLGHQDIQREVVPLAAAPRTGE